MNDTPPLRFAVLGAGFWARVQLAAWGEMGASVCVAVCDPDRGHAEDLARQRNVPAVYDEPAALFAAEKLDFVDIITPVETHAPLVELAARQGLTVICQKPMATSLVEAEKMVETCRAAGVPFFVHENWRWQTPIRELAKVLESGVLGHPFRARIQFSSSFPVFDNQPFLTTLDQFLLTDIGSHVLDAARFLFGEADALFCQTHRAHKNIQGEDVATVMMPLRRSPNADASTTVVCEMSYASRLENERFPKRLFWLKASAVRPNWVRVIASPSRPRAEHTCGACRRRASFGPTRPTISFSPAWSRALPTCSLRFVPEMQPSRKPTATIICEPCASFRRLRVSPNGSGGAAVSERIRATYRIETAFPVEKALDVMMGLQGTGGFVKLPGETDALRERHGARVEQITPLESRTAPSLPGARVPESGFNGTYNRAEVTLSYPLENMGAANLPTLVATVAGSVFDLSEVSGLRLVHLELPQAFADAHPGPQFAIDGTRRLTGVVGRPLIGTIIKPSVGLSPNETAALVRELAEAGVDFIKDDELMANPPHAPLAERVSAVMRVVNEHAARTGKKVMYAFNISDELDAMLAHHDTVLAHGGTCVMVSINSVGLVGVERLRRHSQLPLHGHRNGWAMLTRCPASAWIFSRTKRCGGSRAWTICTSTASPTSSGNRTTPSWQP
jgi:ribulose 1,5-bisphosphate carboxylase large subunit-like protein/predicted dehydrogenase